MCVGVPMKIIEINYPSGIAEARGVTRNVGLQLIPENQINVGDYVIIHVGFAIEKVDKSLADEIWDAFDEILSVMDQEEENA
ncbi:HypC/HybG/HupF family hydrogenase formation chaperone [bacterium]|nr:MAG: HypC/HybG/HupF family hydrogenase formation chaperone [bacterium]